MLHVVSPSLLQSLFLAFCSPAPRTVAAHTLPGYRDTEAGAGGLGRVALIWGGRVEVSTPLHLQTDVLGASAPPNLGLGARLELRWEYCGASCSDGARRILESVPWCVDGHLD